MAGSFSPANWRIWRGRTLFGVEHFTIDPGNTAFTPLNFAYYPYSHSLVALALWGMAAAVLYLVLNRSTVVAAGAVGLTVVSHGCHVISHRPDMPLTIAGPTHLGFGTVAVGACHSHCRSGDAGPGLGLYLRTTRSRDRIGSVGFWSLMVMLL